MRLVIFAILILSLVQTQMLADRTYIEGVRIEVKEGLTRDDKIREIFGQLIRAYEDEQASDFMSHVSQSRFYQDHLTFRQAIENDFRVYDIHDITYQIDRIVADGNKCILYVNWQKRYETLDEVGEKEQRGYSRFLFDEENGVYKLTEIAGNNLWGKSLAEWQEEVADSGEVDGQEENDGDGAPASTGGGTTPVSSTIDLEVTNLVRPFGGAMDVEFDVVNHGTEITDSFSYQIKTVCSGLSDDIITGSFSYGFGPNSTKHVIQNTSNGYIGCTVTVTVDVDDDVVESDETNNITTININ